MKVIFYLLLLNLLWKFAFSLMCPAEQAIKDKTCISNEECCSRGNYLFISDLGRQCIDICPDGYYYVTEGTLKTCIRCFKDHVSSDKSICKDDCGEELIQANISTCILKENCKSIISSNGRYCSDTCSQSEYARNIESEHYKQCTVCPDSKPIPNQNQTNCGLCEGSQIADIQEHKCLSGLFQCKLPKKVQSDQKRCGIDCQHGEYYSFDKTKGINICVAQCEKYVVVEDNSCLDSCPIIDKTTRILENDNLKYRYLQSNLVRCLKFKSQCQGYLSEDGLTCLDECPNGSEPIQDFNGGYIQCTKCSSNTHYFQSSSNRKVQRCLIPCEKGLVVDTTVDSLSCIELSACRDFISSDGLKCMKECDINEFVLLDDTNNSSQQQLCLKVCNSFQFTQNNIIYCISECKTSQITDKTNRKCYLYPAECPNTLSANGKQCVEACDSSKRETSEFNKDNSYKQCTVCGEYYTPASDTVSTCSIGCADGNVANPATKTCLSALTECKNYVSKDSKICSNQCQGTNQYILAKKGYRKCADCNDFYTANQDLSLSTCKPQCDSNQLTIYPTSVCVPIAQGCGNEGVNGKQLFMSSDRKSCDTQCNYPDVQKENQCILESTCTGENEIIDETGLINSTSMACMVKSSFDCKYYESTDGKRCVRECLQIKQAEPELNSKKCRECIPPLKFYLTDKSNRQSGACKEAPITIQEQQSIIESQLETQISSVNDVQSIKTSINDLIQIITASLSYTTNTAQIIDQIERYALELLTLMKKTTGIITPIQYKVQSVGSNTNIKTVFQAGKTSKIPKTSLNVTEMLDDTLLNMFEDNFDENTGYEGIISSIISKNIACKSANCQEYPIIQALAIKKLTIPSRILGTSRQILEITDSYGFTVDFNIKTENSQNNNSKNYVCLTYDLSTNTVTGSTLAKLSADGLTARCKLDGSSSLYLDSTCIYIDKSYCLYSTPYFKEEGLNAGGISGIITGSVALAMILGAGAFFLIKHLIKFKIYQLRSLQYAQPDAHEPEP